MPPSTSLTTINPTQQISTRWAQRSDLPSMASILKTNFLTFEFHDHFCPRRREKQEEFYLFLLARLRFFFVKPTFRFMVCEVLSLYPNGTETREVIGFSGWDAFGEENCIADVWERERRGMWAAMERKLVDLESWHHKYVVNTIFDYAGFKKAWNLLEGAYEHLEEYRNQLHLQFLMVEPKWQKGYGIGRRLLQWGLDASESTGLPVVIESSLVGEEFYRRCGCRLLTKVRIDVVPEKAYDMPVLVYEPGKKPEAGVAK